MKQIVGRLDLELLTAFVAIVDHGGFTRAAQRLHRPQSTVSMQMKRLEDRVGRRLIERNVHAVQLTPAGNLLLGYARRIVALTEEARSRLAAPHISGTIHLGLPEWFAHRRLQAMMAHFARVHPEVELSVRVGDSGRLRSEVAEGRLDVALAIRAGEAGDPPAVHREPLYWVASDSVDLPGDRLLGLALFPPPCPFRSLAMRSLDRHGIPWREVFTSASVDSVRTAVECGLAVSIFPESAISPGLRRLKPQGLQDDLPPTELAIYEAPGRGPGPGEHLAGYLRECLDAPQEQAQEPAMA